MRLQGKHFFLTYPRADFDIDEYNAWLVDKFGENYVGAVICRELHADGTPHRHVALELARRWDTRNPRCFDFTPNGQTEAFHGNYQTARTWKAVLRYVKKTEDWKGYGQYQGIETEDADSDEAERFRGRQSDAFDIARSGLNFEQFITWAISKRLPHSYAMLVWNAIHAERPTVLLGSETLAGTITVPHLSFLRFDDTTRRALVLQGPTGIGKTVWALRNAPKPAMVVTHVDDLKHISADTKCLIFDDMDFKHIPRTSQIHLVDFDLARSVHIRYVLARIPAGMHKIFTCNEFPFIEDQAIRRRIDHVLL